MPTPTYTALANITLGSSASSVTFSSIPNTFRDLVCIINMGTGTSPDDLVCQLNNDTSATYPWVRMFGNASGTGSSSDVGYNGLAVQITGVVSGGMAVFQIFDYSATDKHKTSLSRAGGANYDVVEALASRWPNTAAVNSMKFVTFTGNIASGSTFSLYGIRA